MRLTLEAAAVFMIYIKVYITVISELPFFFILLFFL